MNERSDPTTRTELCPHDKEPCYASPGTPDAHWRCGTVQCAKQSMADCYRNLMSYVAIQGATMPNETTAIYDDAGDYYGMEYDEVFPCGYCVGDRVLPVLSAGSGDTKEIPCPFCTGDDDDE